jgi:hypothetical protein
MRTILTTILLSLFVAGFSLYTSSCKNQQKGAPELLHNDSLQYLLINVVLNDSLVAADNVLSGYRGKAYPNISTGVLDKLASLDSIFQKDDLDFIMQQGMDTTFTFDPAKVKPQVINVDSVRNMLTLGRKDFWKRYTAQYGMTDFCFVTPPYFTLDGNYAVMIAGKVCGPLCGYSALLVLTVVDGNWKILVRFEMFA